VLAAFADTEQGREMGLAANVEEFPTQPED
jgi:hypothetical protein